jgi:hypothetical protein
LAGNSPGGCTWFVECRLAIELSSDMAHHSVIFSAALLAGLAIVGATSARADEGPVIVIPSRPGIPVVINGVDASYAIVEGDWGLARPGIGVTIIGGTPIHPNSVYEPRHPYHPKYGKPPDRGRLEVEPPPNRSMPQPAESFERNWSSSPTTPVPYDPPAAPGSAPVMRPMGAVPAEAVPATVIDPATFPQDFEPVVVVPRRR